MYGYFFPENDQRYMRYEFETVQDARDGLLQRGGWVEINASDEKDKAAFLSDPTGAIVVIRELPLDKRGKVE